MTLNAISSPLRPRTKGFVLTSLIDVIFLLLVFFMLSSQIAPYSLMTVSGGASSEAQIPEQTTPQAAAEPNNLMTFIVSRGHVRSGSATIPLDQLQEALKRLDEEQQRIATVLTTRSATVQDIVTALEIFEISNFQNVRLLMAPS